MTVIVYTEGCVIVRIAIAMPVFNEADGIAETLSELDLAFTGYDITLCLQNDCSTDETINVVQGLNQNLQMKILISSNESNLGHGPTTLNAYKMALQQDPDAILQLDSDGQFFADELVEMCRSLDHDFDVVYGIRKHRFDSRLRRFITFSLKIFICLRFGFYLRDSNTPIRAYRPSSLAILLNKIDSNVIIPNIFLAVEARRLNLRSNNISASNRPRRGEQRIGTMWSSKSIFRSQAKLARFIFRALIQIVKF